MENYKYFIFFSLAFVYGFLTQIVQIFFYKKRIESIINQSPTLEQQEVYLLPFKTKQRDLLGKLSELNRQFNENVSISLNFDFSDFAFAMYHKKKSLILIGDKLFEELPIDELLIVLSHEFYHIKEKHTEKTNDFIYKVLNVSNLMFLIGFGALIIHFKVEILLFLLGLGIALPEYLLIAFFYVFFHALFNLTMTTLILPAMRNKIGRFHELESDLFAAQTIGFDSYQKFNRYFKQEFKDIEQVSKIGWIFQTHPSWDDRLSYVSLNMKHNIN